MRFFSDFVSNCQVTCAEREGSELLGTPEGGIPGACRLRDSRIELRAVPRPQGRTHSRGKEGGFTQGACVVQRVGTRRTTSKAHREMSWCMRGSLPAVAAQSRKSGFPSRLSRVIELQGLVKLRPTPKAVVDVDSGASWGWCPRRDEYREKYRRSFVTESIGAFAVARKGVPLAGSSESPTTRGCIRDFE